MKKSKWGMKVATILLGASVALSSVGVGVASAASHTVKSGDTLWKIGNQYGVSSETIMNLNNLSSTVIYPGQVLKISNTSTYTVKSGDTLWIIANKYDVSYKSIMQWNNLSSTEIYVGQKLKMYGSATTTSNVVDIAKQYLGTKYTWGGVSPSTGFDCSGYVYYVFNKAGIPIERNTAAGYYNLATKVSTPKPGDLVFFAGTSSQQGISHMGIYIGNNQMINASNSGVKIANIYSSYWKQYFVGFGRL